MRDRINRFLFGGDAFKKDFIYQLKYFIIITLGFTVAFSWRETAFDLTQNIVKKLFQIESSNLLNIYTSFTITVFSIIIIWILVKSLEE